MGDGAAVEVDAEGPAPDLDSSPGDLLVLGPMLRHVDDTSATIWVELARPAEVEVLGHRTRSFTVEERHYALVIVEGLEPGTTTPYEVRADGQHAWPEPGSAFPPSVIRTSAPGAEPRILLGSCRASAPHHPPFTLERMTDPEARGVDTLWVHAHRMSEQTPDEWPDLLLLLGDQIYADDSSPMARERIERRRGDDVDVPPSVVITFDQYALLYQEAWKQDAERWLLSTVPSAMIFDDHDMIDDWNISAAWVDDIGREPWWHEHAISGYVSYWVYQHLGNLSPTRLREEGLLEAAVDAGDATALLRDWATEVEAASASPGGYSFSHVRTIGRATTVIVDCRNARVLEPGRRLMVGPEEWDWVRRTCLSAEGDLVIGTTVPVFIADGLHDLMVWNEHVCDGAWGRMGSRWGERVRRSLDLEDWSAFGESFHHVLDLVRDLDEAPGVRSVVFAAGDIHFSYAASLPGRLAGSTPVWQVVSSPIRNALIPPERGVMRLTLTSLGRRLGAALRRSVGAPDSRPSVEMSVGPYFSNGMCLLEFDSDGVRAVFEQSVQEPDQPARLDDVATIALT